MNQSRKTINYINQLSDDEMAKLILRAVKKNRIGIQIILEKTASEVGDDRLLDYIKSLEPD